MKTRPFLGISVLTGLLALGQLCRAQDKAAAAEAVEFDALAMPAKSSDLKDWKFLGPLLHAEYPADLGVPKEEDISCANMFRLGNKRMLLCIRAQSRVPLLPGRL